jgi:hypothetical protein
LTYPETVLGRHNAMRAALAIVAILVLAFTTACGGGTSDETPLTVDEVTAAFLEQGIDLETLAASADAGTVLTPRGSRQVEVVVFPSPREARSIVTVRTGTSSQFEVSHGTDVLFTVRNVYVVFDTTRAEYERADVRSAVLALT